MYGFEALSFCQPAPCLNRKTPDRSSFPLLRLLVSLGLVAAPSSILLAQANTSIQLNVSTQSTTGSTIPAGTLTTLTANVSVGQVVLTVGRVIFCDTAVTSLCSDLHNIGAAQVTSNGAATLNFLPGAGTHEYIAQYVGNNGYASSASSVQTLTVTASNPTQTTLTSTPTPNQASYLMQAAITAAGGSLSPNGTVSLLDLSNNSLSLATTALGSAATMLTLAQVSSPPTLGYEPSPVVVADFNGDGKPDLAVTNPGPPGTNNLGGPLTILLGNGDGTFSPGPIPVTTVYPSVVVAGDFNSDGKLDLAVNGGPDGTLQILLGNGNGTFTVASGANPGISSSSMTVGDFNGDGKPDLAVSMGTVAILLGNGDGTFTAAPTPPGTNNASATAVGDFNGDGKPDLAVLCENYPNPSTVAILIGKGDGTFTATANSISGLDFTSGAVVQPIVVGDFRGNGKADLAITTSLNQVNANGDNFQVNVYLGNGDGTFASPVLLATGPGNSYGLAAGDFNADGKSDIATADDKKNSILLSNGDGTFTVAATVAGVVTGEDVDTIAIGDFNGDGVPDLAQADSDNQAILIDLTSRSSASTVAFANITIPGTGTHNVQATYSGDASFSSSTSSAIPLTASQIATTLQLISSSGSAVVGTQLTLTATLSPYSSGNLTTAAETITFSNNGASIGTATLTSGVATLNITSLPVGSNSLTASYAGDTNFSSASASAVSVVVTAPAGPTVTLSPTNLTFAQQTVGTTTAAQAVTLTNSGQVALALTSIAASGDFAENNSCGTSVAPGANCTIAVTFTPTVAGSRTGTLTVTDNAGGSPQTVALSGTAVAVTLAPGSSALTIASAGGTATTAIQLSSLDGFSGTVNLTCAVNYQGQSTPNDPPTCSLSPAQVQVTGSSPISTTLTISTTAAGSTSARLQRTFNQSLIAFAGLLFLGTMPRRLWRGRLLLVSLCLITLGSMLGCGGSSNSSGSGNTPTPIPGTTSGNYQVLVTGTSGTAKISTTIQLSIQ